MTNFNLNSVLDELFFNGISAEMLHNVSKGDYYGDAIAVSSGVENLKAVFYPFNYETEEEMIDACGEFADHPTVPDINVENITNWEKAKPNLRIGLRQRVDDNVASTYLPNLELEVYPFVEMEIGTVKVTDDLIGTWKMTYDEVFSVATKNTQSHTKVTTMSEILGFDSGLPMYIITSDTQIKGAASMIFYNTLDDLCDKLETDRLAIIPSSIHEVIVVDAELMEKNDFVRMIVEVNQTEVAPEDRLCDFPFEYNRTTGVLRKA